MNENKFGLRHSDIEAIREVLNKFPQVTEALIFGSRAKGNYKNGSDIDIALKGSSLNLDILLQISFQLNEETAMPYKFDVLAYETISEPALREHIDRAGIQFYKL